MRAEETLFAASELKPEIRERLLQKKHLVVFVPTVYKRQVFDSDAFALSYP